MKIFCTFATRAQVSIQQRLTLVLATCLLCLNLGQGLCVPVPIQAPKAVVVGDKLYLMEKHGFLAVVDLKNHAAPVVGQVPFHVVPGMPLCWDATSEFIYWTDDLVTGERPPSFSVLRESLSSILRLTATRKRVTNDLYARSDVDQLDVLQKLQSPPCDMSILNLYLSWAEEDPKYEQIMADMYVKDDQTPLKLWLHQGNSLYAWERIYHWRWIKLGEKRPPNTAKEYRCHLDAASSFVAYDDGEFSYLVPPQGKVKRLSRAELPPSSREWKNEPNDPRRANWGQKVGEPPTLPTVIVVNKNGAVVSWQRFQIRNGVPEPVAGATPANKVEPDQAETAQIARALQQALKLIQPKVEEHGVTNFFNQWVSTEMKPFIPAPPAPPKLDPKVEAKLNSPYRERIVVEKRLSKAESFVILRKRLPPAAGLDVDEGKPKGKPGVNALENAQKKPLTDEPTRFLYTYMLAFWDGRPTQKLWSQIVEQPGDPTVDPIRMLASHYEPGAFAIVYQQQNLVIADIVTQNPDSGPKGLAWPTRRLECEEILGQSPLTASLSGSIKESTLEVILSNKIGRKIRVRYLQGKWVKQETDK